MARRQFFEFILKVLNFFLIVLGLVMVLFGTYHLLKWKQTSDHVLSTKTKLVVAHRLLLAVHQSSKETHNLFSAWFLFLFIAVGVILFSISCIGCIGTRSPCCLSFYSGLMGILVLAELGLGTYIFLDHHWKERVPTDKTGSFHAIYNFLDSHWKIIKWIALGVVLLEVMALCLALYLQTTTRAKYDRANDFVVYPRYQRPVVTSQRSTPRSTPNRSFQNPVSPREGTPTPSFQRAPTPLGGTPTGGTPGGTPTGGTPGGSPTGGTPGGTPTGGTPGGSPTGGTPGGTPTVGTPSRLANMSTPERSEASLRRT